MLDRSITHGPITHAPWLDRHAERITRYAAQLTDAGLDRGARPHLTPARLIAFAREAKREDTYHSTTIEGYRITPEEVDAVLSGRSVAGRTPDEVARQLAIQGYARAFDRTLAVLTAARGPVLLNESLILDLYEALWWPSVEAGIVLEAHELRRYRTRSAFIRHSDHVPPAVEKVPGLVRLTCDMINELAVGPVVRAAVAHWAFEYVHPFPDGNGRVGRLLMNVVLGSHGDPWVTIRAEERQAYFTSLERASVQDDPLPWGRLLAHAVRKARTAAARA
jgi:Fic family protein